MSPNLYRLDVALEQLLAALVESAPYVAGTCLALTLLALLVDLHVRDRGAERPAATGADAAPTRGALELLGSAGAVYAPLSYAAHAALRRERRLADPSAPTAAQLLAGVYLVTVSDRQGKPHGIVLSSLCVDDGDPPSVLVCVASNEPGLDYLLESPAFAVHLLGHDQQALARSAERDVFDLDGWRREGGIPVRSDVVACLRCETVGVSRHGAHAIVVGTVAEVLAAAAQEPLVRLRGRTDWRLSERALVARGG